MGWSVCGAAVLIALVGCARGQGGADTRVLPAPPVQAVLPSSAFLAALPDGETKRRFILDCTGCHTFRDDMPYPGSQPRDSASWAQAIERMVSNFGPASGFPVIGTGRDPAATAAWLSHSLPPRNRITWQWPAQLEASADIREFLLPEPQDLPHDVAIDGTSVIATGMFTGRMYILDPASGVFRTENTPRANPRAVEIDAQGSWWVVLGGPRTIARRAPSGEWTTYDVGYYAHSLALAPDGKVWYNGHFTHQPELIGRIDPVSGGRQDFEVPAHAGYATTTIPYEIRVGADGMVWMSELAGNRLVRHDPRTGAFRTWTMPTAASGPRRLDVDPNGIVWIPEYAANKLARFDPRTETFTEYELPLKDAAPYIVRWDARRNALWIGTGAADALLRFDPHTLQFRYYRLPTADAMIRHMTIDPATGDLWLAPGSSPGTTPARLVRLRPSDQGPGL